MNLQIKYRNKISLLENCGLISKKNLLSNFLTFVCEIEFRDAKNRETLEGE